MTQQKTSLTTESLTKELDNFIHRGDKFLHQTAKDFSLQQLAANVNTEAELLLIPGS